MAKRQPGADRCPLFLHRNGQWCKKIRSRHVYFGTVKQLALEEYYRFADELHRGERIFTDRGRCTIAQARDRYIAVREERAAAGHQSPYSVQTRRSQLRTVCRLFGPDRLLEQLTRADFDRVHRALLASDRSPVTIQALIAAARSMLTEAHEAGLIDEPVHVPKSFASPPINMIRRHRARQAPKVFTPAQVGVLLEKADPLMRAAILLGLNGALLNLDISALRFDHVDLDAGMIPDFPRQKTGVHRAIPLWDVTVDAIRLYAEGHRRTARKASEQLVFVNDAGGPMIRETFRQRPEGSRRLYRRDAVRYRMTKLMRATGVQLERGGFGALRHTFRTYADRSTDYRAINRIMGHQTADMASTYVHWIDPDRLRAVVDLVRDHVLAEWRHG